MSEFNEFEPRLKSAKNRFQLSADLKLEKLNTILSGTINQPYLSCGLNLSRSSNSLNSASGLILFLADLHGLNWRILDFDENKT